MDLLDCDRSLVWLGRKLNVEGILVTRCRHDLPTRMRRTIPLFVNDAEGSRRVPAVALRRMLPAVRSRLPSAQLTLQRPLPVTSTSASTLVLVPSPSSTAPSTAVVSSPATTATRPPVSSATSSRPSRRSVSSRPTPTVDARSRRTVCVTLTVSPPPSSRLSARRRRRSPRRSLRRRPRTTSRRLSKS